MCASRILRLFSVLSFTVYHNFLELKVEPKQEPVLQQSTLRVARTSRAMQDKTTRTSDLFDYLPSTDWFSPAGRRPPRPRTGWRRGAYLPAWQLSQFLKTIGALSLMLQKIGGRSRSNVGRPKFKTLRYHGPYKRRARYSTP